MRARARAQRFQIDVTKNVTTMNIHDHRQYARESDHQTLLECGSCVQRENYAYEKERQVE